MSSLLPGFEYDIFISYRHHDNKSDGWVTEFVAHLREELEATMKDKITLYFEASGLNYSLGSYDIAGAYAVLGEKDKACEWLEKMPYANITQVLITRDPFFDALRNEARFQKIIAKHDADSEEILRVINQEDAQNDLRLILKK